jgi:hypothetical protein
LRVCIRNSARGHPPVTEVRFFTDTVNHTQ